MQETYYIAPGFPAEITDEILIRNITIGDLQISNIARTDAEILAAYQSGQPLPVDEYTTLKMDFDGTLQPTVAQQRDLSMVLTAGQEYTLSATAKGRVYCSVYDPNLLYQGVSVITNNGTASALFVPTVTGQYKVLVSSSSSTDALVKLEKGNKPTDWSPAPEDVNAAISDVATKIEEKTAELNISINSISSTVESITTDISNLREETRTLITQTANSWSATLEQTIIDFEAAITEKYRADIQATVNDLNLTFTEYSNAINNINTEIAEIKTNFTFSASGLTIGKSDSPFSINISNEQINFLDRGNAVTWISSQKMFITSAEITNNIQVGNHVIEKYNSDITLVRWVG